MAALQNRPSAELALEIEKRSDARELSILWQALINSWIQLISPQDPFKNAFGEVLSERDYSYWDYRRSSALDLEYLSMYDD